MNRPTPHRDPFVLNDIVNGESILWIRFEHPPNEFFGVRRDVGPFGLGKLILARANAFLHAGGYGEAMVAVEWGKSTQPTGRGVNVQFWHLPPTHNNKVTYRMYMITPRDQISQDLSYFSGPSTSGAKMKKNQLNEMLSPARMYNYD